MSFPVTGSKLVHESDLLRKKNKKQVIKTCITPESEVNLLTGKHHKFAIKSDCSQSPVFSIVGFWIFAVRIPPLPLVQCTHTIQSRVSTTASWNCSIEWYFSQAGSMLLLLLLHLSYAKPSPEDTHVDLYIPTDGTWSYPEMFLDYWKTPRF